MFVIKLFKSKKDQYGWLKGTVFCALFIMHRILEKCYVHFIKLFFPIDKKSIIFKSTPDFSDNARALAEYMVMNHFNDRYKIYFDVNNPKEFQSRHKGISFISLRSNIGLRKLRYLKKVYTAGFLMSTHFFILSKRVARKDQVIINLWHGCSFKDKLLRDCQSIPNFDVAIVPGELFVKTKSYFWNVDEKCILPLGYPRYDWLREKDVVAQSMLESFKKDSSTKVVLWMPTFRIDKRGLCNESKSITQFPLLDEKEKWVQLNQLCIDLDIVLLVKLHPFQTEYDIPFEEYSNISKIDNQFFDDADVPMYKFVALTDALITDYSSIAIDYLIVNHPIAYTLDDFEAYKSTRGFVISDPRVYMPGHHLYKYEDLESFLLDLNNNKDPYKIQREQMFGKAICFSDNYCKSILDYFGVNI